MRPLPAGCVEVALKQGEHHFGGHETRIRTLLGSCVAVTLWHPLRRVGGMCHFLVPAGARRRVGELDGRFGWEAVLMLIRDATAAGTDPRDCQFKIFGGGNMFPGQAAADRVHVGTKNIHFVERFLAGIGQSIEARHVGGAGHRIVVFDVWSGNVWLRHQKLIEAEAVSHG